MNKLDYLHIVLAFAAVILPMLAAWLTKLGHAEASHALTVLTGVIQGVEKMNSGGLKQDIKEAATSQGVQEELDKIVQSMTKP